jgi:hypothetical protein
MRAKKKSWTLKVKDVVNFKKPTYICIQIITIMPEKIIPSSKNKSIFTMHVVLFILANAGLWSYWYFIQGANHQWVYPWGIWITAAWALSLIGHWCAVYTSYEDQGNNDYQKQKNG